MTLAKQVPIAWRKRVDSRLNKLATGQRELKERLDNYESILKETNTILNQKLDQLLLLNQHIGVMKKGAKRVLTGLHWLLTGSSKLSLGLLGLLTLLWVTYHSSTWQEWWENFIQVFNGTTRFKP